jgi:hypothetical protein
VLKEHNKYNRKHEDDHTWEENQTRPHPETFLEDKKKVVD